MSSHNVLCVSVHVLVTIANPAKTAEPIDMPIGETMSTHADALVVARKELSL